MSTLVKTFSWLLDFFPKRFIQLQFKFTVSSYPIACRFHVHKDNSLCVNIKFKMSESLAVVWKYGRVFVLGHYMFRVTHSFPRSRKTVRVSEQIMSAAKYPSLFSSQIKAIV